MTIAHNKRPITSQWFGELAVKGQIKICKIDSPRSIMAMGHVIKKRVDIPCTARSTGRSEAIPASTNCNLDATAAADDEDEEEDGIYQTHLDSDSIVGPLSDRTR